MPETKQLKEMDADELRGYAGELREEFVSLIEKGERSEGDNSRTRTIRNEVGQVDTLLSFALLQQQKEADRSSGSALAAFGHATSEGARSGGEMWMDSSEMKAWADRNFQKEFGNFQVAINGGIRSFEAGQRDPSFIGTDFGTGGPGNASTGSLNSLLPVGQPIPPAPRQAKLYLRDLIPTMTTGLSTIPYVRELAPTSSELGASAVPEGAVKPDVSLAFQGASASPTVIAADMTMSKQLFEDAAFVVQYVNGRLPYLVKFKEDNEFLNGSGTWPDVQGILNTPNIQTRAADADIATTLGMSMAQVEVADGEATAVVMHPLDAWAMFTKRASTSGIFDAGTPFSSIPMTIWGQPVYRTRVFPRNKALVSDFARGAVVIDRQQVTIETFTQHADYANRNLLLLRCEERVGLMVPRPDLFVYATIPAS